MSKSTGLFAKVTSLFLGTAHDAVDAVTSAGVAARQDVREVEAEITKADEALLDARAEVVLLRNKRSDAQKQVDHWTGLAKKAIAAGDDTLAADCLKRKKPFADMAAEMDTQIGPFEANVNALEQRIGRMRARRDEMARTTDMLEARSQVASATERVADALGAIDGKGAAADFARLNDKVIKDEARAQAKILRVEDAYGSDLETRVNNLAARSSVDDELAALKAEVTK